MDREPKQLYLERRSYRRRRLIDAARLLPVVGAVAFLLVLLAPSGGEAPASTASTARVGLYIFAVWAVLIALAAVLARLIGRPESAPPPQPASHQGGATGEGPARGAGR